MSAIRHPLRRLRDTPIQRKLIVILMITTTGALALAGAGVMLADSYLFYRQLQRDLSTLAEIVADNTTAALAFDDPAAATETLRALRARPHVITACIFDSKGSLFARYARPDASVSCSLEGPPGDRSATALTLRRSVYLAQRHIGTLIMVYDLGELPERMWLYGLTVLGVLVLSTGAALALSSRLRALIAIPIVDLSRIATLISRTRNFGIRASRYSDDELGTLVDAFNEMLSAIQSRDEDLRKALADLQSSNANLARSNEDLSRFAYIAAHDLQEPLRMIAVYSQLLISRYPPGMSTDASMFVDQIVGGTRRMGELLTDLLAYMQVGADTESPTQPVDLNEVLAKVRKNLQMVIKDSGASIVCDPLPVVKVYEAHFSTLFQNLLSNAIKYRADRPLRIRIAARPSGDSIEFAFADNGMGIAPEYHTVIFAAFKRLHGKSIPGTGIGLAICERVIERYGGRIWVESTEGSGATFRFTLPNSLVVAPLAVQEQ
ncbi:MAG: hypothetical protein IT168_13825 [Bryobacterales bacterium]|nr:hypothetical protein [Bryobacterales bacterium]